MAVAGHTVKNRLWVYVLLILPVFVVLGIYIPLADQLPEVIATHWSSTYPDGFTRTELFVPTCIGLSILGTIISLISVAQHRKPALLLTLMFIGSLLSWTTVGVFIGSAVPTVLAESPETAVIGYWIIPTVACTLVALTPLWICGVYQTYSKQLQDQRQARIAAGQGLAVPPSQAPEILEDSEFSETMKGPWWLLVLGLIIAVTGVYVFVEMLVQPDSINWTSAVIGLATCFIVTPLVLGLCMIRVTITDQRTRVSSAILGFPLRTISLDDIQSVTHAEINPMAWGGWGWRFFPGGSAVVLRRAEGLAFELKNSSRFAVTIPHAQRGAEKLNTLLSQRET